MDGKSGLPFISLEATDAMARSADAEERQLRQRPTAGYAAVTGFRPVERSRSPAETTSGSILARLTAGGSIPSAVVSPGEAD